MAAQSALLVLAYLVMLVGGAFGWIGLFAVAGLAAIIGEFAVARWSPQSQVLLEKVGLHWSYRQLTRDLAAVLLVVAEVRLSGGELTLLLVLPAAVWVVSVFAGALSTMIERRNPISAMVRNIELGPLSSAPQPPAWAAAVAGDRMPLLNLLLVPAGVAAAVQHDPTPFFVAGAVAVVATGLVGAIIALTWLRGRGAGQGPLLPAVQRWLDSYRPEVALYFAGPAKDVYQANMWLAPTEALQQRAVVLMRSREAFLELADTRLPVICVPAGVDFMNLDLGGVRAALYCRQRRREHPHAPRAGYEARLRRARRQRQAGQRQPLQQGVRRGLGRRSGRPGALRAGRRGRARRGHRRDRPAAARRGAHLRRRVGGPAVHRALRADLGGLARRRPVPHLAGADG